MANGYDYAAIKQRHAQTIRARFGGVEMLNLKQAALVLGYKEPKNAMHILAGLPHCEYSPRKNMWAISDIAAELARRTRLPQAGAS